MNKVSGCFSTVACPQEKTKGAGILLYNEWENFTIREKSKVLACSNCELLSQPAILRSAQLTIESVPSTFFGASGFFSPCDGVLALRLALGS
jgi:hypothetical protein